MALTPGSRLGVYVIAAHIGEGGMGSVYRAHDTRLNREVALKVLPDAVANDADRLARFTREAQALAALNHPGIAQVYGFDEFDQGRALVMELVDGEDLSERMARGALPLTEAMSIGRQVAEALEAAHERGIVHRDLKPSNIRIRPDGAIKVLDFGLAKAFEPPGTTPLVSTLPTLTTPVTVAGMVLGTAAYMSPEQARGATVDKRTDVWAFGVVLWEMLVGKRLFEGATASDIVAAVLMTEPDWGLLPSATPPPVRALVAGCLVKDVRQRIADMSVARFAFGSVGPSVSSSVGKDLRPADAPSRTTRWTLWLVSAGTFVVGAAAALLLGRSSAPVVRPDPIQFEVMPPNGVMLSPSPVASTAQLALSPDGTTLAFVATARRSLPQVWLRRLDSVEAKPIAGTEGAAFPFWSPDSRSLAFYAGGKLKTISIDGGVPLILADAVGRGGSWNANGVILFSSWPNTNLSRVQASGGVVTSASTLDATRSVVGHNWPVFLPDGVHFLYYQRSTDPQFQGVFVGALDSKTTSQLFNSDGLALYSAGHVVSVKDGTLFAQPFDPRTLTLSGTPFRVADHVGYFSGAFGFSAVSVSHTGLLAVGPGVRLTTSLQWIDRTGGVISRLGQPDVYSSPRVSPDQRTVAVALAGSNMAERDVWLMDGTRGSATRATFDPAADWFPVWSSKGNRLFFGTTRQGVTAVFEQGNAGADHAVMDLASTRGMAMYPTDVAADDAVLVVEQSTPKGYDLATIELSGTHRVQPYLATPFNEIQGRLSPDGQWLAYASDESGRFEVYVRRFPSAQEPSKVSLAGGMQPEWRRDGKELFFIATGGQMMAVPVATGVARFEAGTPSALFDVEVPQPNAPYPNDYSVSADGQRFIVNTVVDQPARQALTVTMNWPQVLSQPAK